MRAGWTCNRRTFGDGAILLIATGFSSKLVSELGADIVNYFMTALSGTQVVPPISFAATGMATATLNINVKFYWSIAFAGLTGPASAALFHGPAAPGTTAGAMVNAGANTLDSPIKGSIHLTPGQITD